MIPAASTLDRDSSALVIIDVQERLASAMACRAAVVERAAFLARVAEIVGMPVIVTRQYPRGLGDIDPALADVLDSACISCGGVRGGGSTDGVDSPGAADDDEALTGRAPGTVDKVTFDCFREPSFVSAVVESGARQLLLAGMETHICVTQTALAGLREGFDVHVCADACCSRDASHHTLALSRLRHAGAVVTCAESAAYELVRRAGTEEFKALLAIVKG